MGIVRSNGVTLINKIILLKYFFRDQILSPSVFSIARSVNKPYVSVAETPIIRVMNIDDGIFSFEVRTKLEVTPDGKCDVQHVA